MEELMGKLSDKDMLLYSMQLGTTLSQRATNPLGEWDMRFQYDREAVAAELKYVYLVL